MKRKFTTVELAYAALGAVLITICSWISIPTVVPFTMQTFAIFFLLRTFGGRVATASVILFMLLGVVGIPVFSGFKAGAGVLLGPTGGYVIGFILMGLLYQTAEALFDVKLPVAVAAMLIGLFVCYAFGTAWFMVVYARNTGTVGVGTALAWCVLPFIIPDLVKMALALAFSERVRKHIR